MAEVIGALYHWSPTVRREAILRDGLKVYSEPVTHSGAERYPYLCFGPTPSSSWGLSGDMEWTSEHEQWDLWQVRLVEGDEVHVRAEFGPAIYEVRVRNSIPADRVWYVATREPAFARLAEAIDALRRRDAVRAALDALPLWQRRAVEARAALELLQRVAALSDRDVSVRCRCNALISTFG